MVRISKETVDRAFEAFRHRYVLRNKKAWDLNEHGRLWASARTSVELRDGGEGFVETLKELRKHWQIARGKGVKMLDLPRIFPLLQKKASKAATICLSHIHEGDAQWLFRLVSDVSDVKRVNGKPSLMAISKVLHFFNPRLFVIVDRAMVWDWTFEHRWLWNSIADVRDRVDALAGCDPGDRDESACDISSYVAILIWSAQLMRRNPHVSRQFALFLRRHVEGDARLPVDLDSYEAVALEWLMLGLVELPPAGVTFGETSFKT